MPTSNTGDMGSLEKGAATIAQEEGEGEAEDPKSDAPKSDEGSEERFEERLEERLGERFEERSLGERSLEEACEAEVEVEVEVEVEAEDFKPANLKRPVVSVGAAGVEKRESQTDYFQTDVEDEVQTIGRALRAVLESMHPPKGRKFGKISRKFFSQNFFSKKSPEIFG